MRHDQVWEHIHAERAALAGHLATLTPEQWRHETLCRGWTVLDTAAHVISNPQLGVGHVLAMTGRNLGRGYNAMIDREVRRRGRGQTPERVLADFTTYAGSTRHVFVTTSVEPLLDVLVHTQDMLRPLGIRHDMPPEAAAVAADRARLLGLAMGWRAARGLRLVATDTDWARGRGPVVEGPMAELLMLCTGREPDRSLLSA